MTPNNYGPPEKISGQAIYDKVVAHLHSQGKPAKNQNGTCVYRSSDGGACAVGCLISDSDYSVGFEGETVERLLNKNFFRTVGLDVHSRLLSDLQRVHDGWLMGTFDKYHFSDISKSLSWVAEKNGLSTVLLNSLKGEKG